MGRLGTSVINLLDRKPRVIRLDDRAGDSEAAHELAVTTHRFSKRARAMVDDKLSLSAALMRAGEVQEARQLLAEAEEDLRAEEADLIRQVEELTTYRSMHKPNVVYVDRPSRGSLARTLAVAMASSAVIALATMGGAVVGLFEPNAPIRRASIPTIDRIGGQAARSIQSAAARRGIAVLINGVEVVLTRAEWRALKKAQRDGDEAALNDLLDEIAPELTVSASGALVEVVSGTASVLEATVRAASETTEDSAGSHQGETKGSGDSTQSEAPAEEEKDGEASGQTQEPPAEDDGSGTAEDDGGEEPGAVQGSLGASIGGDSVLGDADNG